MKKIFSFAFCIAFHLVLFSQTSSSVSTTENIKSQKTFLSIKNGGHTAIVRNIAITNDGKTIITAGDDKVIYIRNAETGEVIDALYGSIDEGNDGKIYALSLSPDNKYLAVGGSFSSPKKIAPIRLYDFPNRKLIGLLEAGKIENIKALDFTNDSKYLVSGVNTTIYVWDMATMKLFKSFEDEHELIINSVAAYKNEIVSSAEDSKVVLWNFESNKRVKVDTTHTKQRNWVAISPNGQTIASVGLDNKLIIYDSKLNVTQTIDNVVSSNCIAFSPDSKKMFLGAEGDSIICNLYENVEGKWLKSASYKNMNFVVLAASFIDNSTVVCAGGENHELTTLKLFKDQNSGKLSLKEKSRFSGNGRPVYGIGIKDNLLFYTNIEPKDLKKVSFTKSFDLQTKKVAEVLSTPEGIATTIQKFGDYTLQTATIKESGSFFNPIPNNALNLMRRGFAVRKIFRTQIDGNSHTAFTFTKEGNIISGSSTGIILAYNIEGVILSRFVGHTGTVTNLAITADGKYLLSSSLDQTIRMWKLDEIGGISKNVPAPAMVVDPAFEEYYKQRNLVKKSQEASISAWEMIIADMKSLKVHDYVEFFQKALDFHKSGLIQPIANFYVSTDNEWIIWSTDGYFTSSKYGGKYIGYHVNQGYDKEAKFYPFEQFDIMYNRPDIMLKRVGINDPNLETAYLNAYKKRIKKLGFNMESLSNDIHLPEVILISRSNETTSRFTDVDFEAKDDIYSIDRINILVNDIPIFGQKGISLKGQNIKSTKQKIKVELTNGKNKIQVSALNNQGAESMKETYYVTCSDPNPRLKTRYAILIGVSDYQNNDFDLKYAAKDALDFANLLNSTKGNFSSTKTLVIKDSEATRENIIKAKQFLMQSKVDDQAILFVAGHGLLDNELNWYFATTDIDFSNPSVRGVEYSDLEGLLDSIPARSKILFMDACHSGEIDKEDSQLVSDNSSRNENVNSRGFKSVSSKQNSVGLQSSFELMQELFTDLSKGSGAIVISSASGAEFAYESPQWNNGVFTFSLIEGFRSKNADLNGDGKIKVSELRDYVSKRVVQLTNGKQNPTMRKENLEFDHEM
jgi:WD40 repeat protein